MKERKVGWRTLLEWPGKERGAQGEGGGMPGELEVENPVGEASDEGGHVGGAQQPLPPLLPEPLHPPPLHLKTNAPAVPPHQALQQTPGTLSS